MSYRDSDFRKQPLHWAVGTKGRDWSYQKVEVQRRGPQWLVQTSEETALSQCWYH